MQRYVSTLVTEFPRNCMKRLLMAAARCGQLAVTILCVIPSEPMAGLTILPGMNSGLFDRMQVSGITVDPENTVCPDVVGQLFIDGRRNQGLATLSSLGVVGVEANNASRFPGIRVNAQTT